MSTPATAVAAAIVLTDLDPTGIATNILNLAVAIHEQYEQMQANRGVCKDLDKQVVLISKVVHDLMKQKQTVSCQEVLNVLKESLIECQGLIQKVSTQKSSEAFIVAGSDKENVEKLTAKLRDMRSNLNLALSAQASNRVEEYMGSESDIREIIETIKVTVQISSSTTYTQLNSMQQSVSVISQQLGAVQQQLAHHAQSNQPVVPKDVTFGYTNTRSTVDGNQLNIGQPQSQALTQADKERQQFENSQRAALMNASVTAANHATNLTHTTISFTGTEHNVRGHQVNVHTTDNALALVTAALAVPPSSGSSSAASSSSSDRRSPSPK